VIKHFTAAIATAALGLALVGCGSEKSNTTSPPTSKPASGATSSSAGNAAPGGQAHKTIGDYINDNHLTDAVVHQGDPGAPKVDLPVPDGWKVNDNADASYGGIVLDKPANPADPPNIIAVVHKLTGNVDPAQLLQYAPGTLQNLQGFDGGAGNAATLGNFQAWQLSGAYTKDGVKRTAAQKTVVIPTQGGVFVLQLDADSLESDQGPLMDATQIIDDHTTITAG
jgi:Probable lipoprotein LpqN